MKAAVIVPAAGRGLRMGESVNKQYIPLQNKPVLAHALTACIASQCFSDIIVVVTPGEEEIFRRDVLLRWFAQSPITVVTGGKERQDSVYNGLQYLPRDTDLVCIHDGARPMTRPTLFSRCLSGAETHGAAIAAVAVKDTIKIAEDGFVVETPRRDTLWAVQTPQAFRLGILMDAHQRAKQEGFYSTDDAALLEHYGYPICVIEGDYENIKVTTPEDMVLAEAFLRRRQHADRNGL